MASISQPVLEEVNMLRAALTFLVIGLIAALLGFTTIAGASIAIAKFFAFLFLALFVILLIAALLGGGGLTARGA